MLEDLNPFCFRQKLQSWRGVQDFPRQDRRRQFSEIKFLNIFNNQVRTCTIEYIHHFVLRFIQHPFFYDRILRLSRSYSSLISFIIALPGLKGIWLIAVSLILWPGTWQAPTDYRVISSMCFTREQWNFRHNFPHIRYKATVNAHNLPHGSAKAYAASTINCTIHY